MRSFKTLERAVASARAAAVEDRWNYGIWLGGTRRFYVWSSQRGPIANHLLVAIVWFCFEDPARNVDSYGWVEYKI